MARLSNLLRRLLPWIVSAGTLGYVFGYAIDWQAIPDATAGANMPLFVGITIADKLMFFFVWGLLQAEAIRRFVEPVAVRDVLEVKGGSELVRTLNNSLADAVFMFGVSQLTRGRMAAVVAVATIPFGCHFAVLLLQTTGALFFLEGDWSANRDVLTVVALGWLGVALVAVAQRVGFWRRLFQNSGLTAWIDRVRARDLLPFVGWFVLFAFFDVLIQGLASRAFGVSIPWIDLAARLPILYIVMSIPSLGNFGTREIAWAQSFADYGTREALIAFALWTNVVFLVMHAAIGVFFLSRALALVRDMRKARAEGDSLPKQPFLHDSIDP